MKNVTYTLNNWELMTNQNGYTPIELSIQFLCGNVQGHHKRPCGQYIETSRIVAYNPDTKEIRTLSGSHITLGTVHPKYEARFPGAAKRVHKKLSEKYPCSQ